MNKQSWLLNLSLLKTHPAFRAVFLARFISIVSLGLLGVNAGASFAIVLGAALFGYSSAQEQLAMAFAGALVASLIVAFTGSQGGGQLSPVRLTLAGVALAAVLEGLTSGAMFVGLMVGGVLADRYERKKVILLARGTCGIGFIGLCLNALLPEPSLLAIYLLGLWDGFFASLGVTALLAATPALVGRENLMQAGAITMLTVRLGSVISPMIGGLLLATGGVAWNYGLAAAGTFITTLTLLRLPLLAPPPPCI